MLNPFRKTMGLAGLLILVAIGLFWGTSFLWLPYVLVTQAGWSWLAAGLVGLAQFGNLATIVAAS
ncbi:MAG: hypothetical protein KI792_12620 [Alphaproteobacteria bacterium]|nr:hypothetical protein [Alphaproteobacteria bacterium SS10]